MGKARRKYMKIDFETRKKVINFLETNNENFREAAELFNLKLSTIRAIYNRYKTDGKIF